MDYKHKVFCDAFIDSFDFNQSCKDAKVNKNKMIVYVSDTQSEIHEYIKEQVDIYSMSNSFITTDLIKYKLGQIVLNSEHIHQIQAAKLLLGYEDSPDKAEEFLKLIEAVKQNNKTKDKDNS